MSHATKCQVVILYNEPASGDAGAPVWQESEAGVLVEVDAVAEALSALGVNHRRAGIRRLADIPAALGADPGATVFNLVERLDGAVSAFNYVPAVCEALGHPCTGSSSDGLTLTLDKWLTKARLLAWGIGAPRGAVVPPGMPASSVTLPPPPLFIKPLATDGSEGIDAGSLARDSDAVDKAVRRVHERCAQPALVEQYIEGREVNVSMVELESGVTVLPLSEIDFSLFPAGRAHVVDYAVKWIAGTIPGHVSPRRVPAEIDDPTATMIRREALRVWQACDCRGYVRVDCRLDAAGRLYVLEVNANPDVSPKAGLPASLAAAGIPFQEFVRQMVTTARSRE